MDFLNKLKKIWKDNLTDYFIAIAVVSFGAYIFNAGNLHIVKYAIPSGILITTFLMFVFGFVMDSVFENE